MLNSHLDQQNVFIVGAGSLLDEGVTKLLSRQNDFSVMHLIYADELSFLNMIRQGRPDVILVTESGSLDSMRILNLVSSHPMVTGLCIVIIHLCRDVINVYERPTLITEKLACGPQRIILKTGNDLFMAVRRKQNEQPETGLLTQ